MYFDPYYFIVVGPAFLLALWAQWRVRSTYAEAQQVAAPLSGAAAARHILDSAGLRDVAIEVVPGHLTDHYDPGDRVLRLSEEVYHNRSMAAVGIAAHEAGHALQHARAYAPLVVRNAAVPVAGFGSNISILLLIIGAVLSSAALVWAGIIAFSAVVFFQLVNLPVEFNASARAKAQLAELGIVSRDEMLYVDRVLGAAAMTYVAATLQAILTLLYFLLRFTGGDRE
ncbi:MAG: zinc metallopeptidase [Thermoguttaceae bacterium]|jgi:Zn-dependent membrane protease YugP|nr:zinc metallopeptidase [Thermoguttaceae bacterium]